MKIVELRKTLAGAGCVIADTGNALRIRHDGRIAEIKHPTKKGGKIDPNGVKTVLRQLGLRQLERR